MLHILLHRPFLPEGHLSHLANLDDNFRRDICISAAFKIYELAKVYREAFSLRRAPYMFPYALFCAASIILFKSINGREAVGLPERDIIGFFWMALKELQNGANFGLERPIMIIRSLIEHQGIDLSSILGHGTSDHEGSNKGYISCSQRSTLDVSLSGTPGDCSAGNLDQNMLLLDNSDFGTTYQLQSETMNGFASPIYMNHEDDSLLYGLFKHI
jgi:hypothetical protein